MKMKKSVPAMSAKFAGGLVSRPHPLRKAAKTFSGVNSAGRGILV